MQAINHIATALILKKKFPAAPLFGLILATEAVEYIWVALNLIGVEKTQIGPEMASVADIRLTHMPFSHSILTSVILGLAVVIIVRMRRKENAGQVAIAMGLGVVSHIVLDLVVHARDIPIMPFFFQDIKLGTGLYAQVPIFALLVETCWGIFCWWAYRGNWKLLALIVVLGLTSVPFYSVTLNGGEDIFAGQSVLFAAFILFQICVTSCLVWVLARTPQRTAE